MVYIKQNKSGVGAHAHNMYNVDPFLAGTTLIVSVKVVEPDRSLNR
jgi:hypothetical protein